MESSVKCESHTSTLLHFLADFKALSEKQKKAAKNRGENVMLGKESI